MKPLYAKELRLLQPAYLMALLLAVVPVWLLPRHPHDAPEDVAVVPFVFGVVMLALSGFGREFGMQTFALQLAQPVERWRIWRAKSTLLAAAIASVFLAWCVCCSACLHTVSRSFVGSEAFVIGGAATVVAFAGGLWTTLLLRQVAAAFWFTILIPGSMAMCMHQRQTWQVLLALGLYAVAGVWWARRQFLAAQETSWTGGVVSLPSWRGAKATLGVRKHRPWAALFWKELQLHQVGLAGMAWLFLMHVGVVALRRMDSRNFSDAVRMALEVFGGIWLVVPLLASSVSVAEERKLGTIGQQLSLPVSRRVQFGIKLFLALLIGGVLSSLLLCTVEGISSAIGAGHGVFGEKATPTDMAILVLVFVGIAFISFYGSTLARNFVQALAFAVVGTISFWIFGLLAPNQSGILPAPAGRGFLIYYIAGPALLSALLWLAWSNFKSASDSDHLWRHNAIILSWVVVGVLIATSAIYNRFWEVFTPVDPPSGVAQITGSKPVVIHTQGSTEQAAVLPDGRLWVDCLWYDPGRRVLGFGENSGFYIGGHWTRLSGDRIAAGSNWVRAVANFRETVAIRSEGTLWVSEKPRRSGNSEDAKPRGEQAPALTQFGSETNWQDVVQEYYSLSVVLLKQDGTLWRLGTTSYSGTGKKPWPGLQSFTPQRLVAETGFDRILAGVGCIHAWKTDGSAWAVRAGARGDKMKENEMGVVLDRTSFLDNTKWRGLARFGDRQVGLRDDGTLWGWTTDWLFAQGSGARADNPTLVRISSDDDWTSVAGTYETLALRKADGSAWRWVFPGWDRRAFPFKQPPVRLGSSHDWIGVGSALGGVITLAADGRLYYWSGPASLPSRSDVDQPMLAPSRKPMLIEDIFHRTGERR
jgi:hypothetical protein